MPNNTETETAWMEGYSKRGEHDNAEAKSLVNQAIGAVFHGNRKVALARMEQALEELK